MRFNVLTKAVCFALAILVTPVAGFAKTKGVPEPLSAGPFPVGVITTVFVDASRTDNVTKKERTLVTEIWYPAADAARRMAKNKYSDFIPGGVTAEIDDLLKKTYRLGAAEIDRAYWNDAYRNAPVRQGRFPVVIFSHGNGGSRHQNTFWCDYLASHGYIVVSADHTGNARMTIIDGKPVLFQASERNNSAKDRPRDVSFLLDQMIAWDRGGDKRLAGRIDTARAAAAGMSFGSFTSHWVADLDPRFKAIVAMSGAPETHTNLTVPTLRMLGTEDRTLGERGNKMIRDRHAAHTGPAFLIEMKDGGHYSFTDMFKINKSFGDGVGRGKRGGSGAEFDYTDMETTYKIINSYSVAFLGYYLKGQKEYLSFLNQNHWPAVMTWEAKGEVALTNGRGEKAAGSKQE
jgi:predicted dienelactone hydrolase